MWCAGEPVCPGPGVSQYWHNTAATVAYRGRGRPGSGAGPELLPPNTKMGSPGSLGRGDTYYSQPISCNSPAVAVNSRAVFSPHMSAVQQPQFYTHYSVGWKISRTKGLQCEPWPDQSR